MDSNRKKADGKQESLIFSTLSRLSTISLVEVATALGIPKIKSMGTPVLEVQIAQVIINTCDLRANLLVDPNKLEKGKENRAVQRLISEINKEVLKFYGKGPEVKTKDFGFCYCNMDIDQMAVSYTHLTLPTIYSV
eukprot:TRINITY_DN11854_c0_g1_i2.p1 TRINITY_DN11854_c0_g1~~TRINITY_DN11854_c0_g1_i2.p1  ORF type:complete len:136 (-),score=25.63 TRINITY_DN11854_c0_g1_i2:34-441(-)